MNSILSAFSYSFITRALVVGTLVSLCASLLGVSLVLKRCSMIGDGLSHVGFGAIAVAAALGLSPLKVTIPIVVVSAFVLLKLSGNAKVKGDAAIGVISTGALAFGVMVVSLGGVNSDLSSYLFGSILAINREEAYVSIVLSAIVLAIFCVLYNAVFAVTFDENFSRAVGVKSDLFDMLVAVLTAITIVLGMRMMGALLISALIILPPLSAMRVFKSFCSVTIASAVISAVCFSAGIMLSYMFDLPAGATVVIVNILIFAAFSAIGYKK